MKYCPESPDAGEKYNRIARYLKDYLFLAAETAV
jgi:hypothetical protein